MERLKEMRDRIENGEDQMAVVLPELADRLQLTAEQKERFDLLIAVGAYLEATILLIREDMKFESLVQIQITFWLPSNKTNAYISDEHDTHFEGPSPEVALCAAYIMAKIKNIEARR